MKSTYLRYAVLTGATVLLALACSAALGGRVIYQGESGGYAVRAVLKKSPPFIGIGTISIEATRQSRPTVRVPIFTALDFLSDDDVRDYQIDGIEIHDDESQMHIRFEGGEAVAIPVFFGVPSRNELRKYQKIKTE